MRVTLKLAPGLVDALTLNDTARRVELNMVRHPTTANTFGTDTQGLAKLIEMTRACTWRGGFGSRSCKIALPKLEAKMREVQAYEAVTKRLVEEGQFTIEEGN